MKITKRKLKTILAGAVVATASAGASATGLDFSGVTSAVDGTTVVTAISALAAIKMLPGAAKWGYNKVIGWFR